MKEFITNIWANYIEPVWQIGLVRTLVFLILAFIVAGISSLVVRKLIKLLKIDAKLDKWGVNEGQAGTSRKFIGKLVFLIVFLLFLPSIFEPLGLTGVTEPFANFAATCINYIPNIIAAFLVIFVGLFVGRIVAQIVTILLAKTKLDNLTRKVGSDTVVTKLSQIIGNVVYAIIIMIVIVQALTVLKLEAISTPALAIINSVFAAIPSILLAAVVIGFGVIVGNIACSLLANVLVGANFDGLVEKIAPGKETKVSLTKITVNTVRVIIMVFIIAQGIDILGLTLLSNILTAVIAYIPMIVKSIIIAAIAFFGAMLLESFLKKTMPKAKALPVLAKALIYVLAGFMILSQLAFAAAIVNSAFVIILCALAVAFAIAFGIGGRDFARKTLEKIDAKKEEATEEAEEEVVVVVVEEEKKDEE